MDFGNLPTPYKEGVIHTKSTCHPNGLYFQIPPFSDKRKLTLPQVPQITISDINSEPAHLTVETGETHKPYTPGHHGVDVGSILQWENVYIQSGVMTSKGLCVGDGEANINKIKDTSPLQKPPQQSHDELSSETEEDDMYLHSYDPLKQPTKEYLKSLIDNQLNIIFHHLEDKRLFKAMGYYQELEFLIKQLIDKFKLNELQSNEASTHISHNLSPINAPLNANTHISYEQQSIYTSNKPSENSYTEPCTKSHNETPIVTPTEATHLISFCQSQLDSLNKNITLRTLKINHDVSIRVLEAFSLEHLKPHYEFSAHTDPFYYTRAFNKILSEEIEALDRKFRQSRSEKLMELSSPETCESPKKSNKHRKHRHLFRSSTRGQFRKASLKLNTNAKTPKNELDGWARDKEKFIDMAYRLEKNLSISIRARGKLPCPIINLLSIINEVDLADRWAPYLKHCGSVVMLDKATQVIRQVFDYPLIGNKESVSYAYAVNCLQEFGCIMLFSVDPPENELSTVNITIDPPKKKNSRIKCADLCFIIYPRKLGQKSLLELYTNFYHGMSLIPGRLVAYLVKKLIRSMFVSIVKVTMSSESSIFAERIKQNPEFYQWLEHLIEHFYLHDQDETHAQIENMSLCSYEDEHQLE